MKKKTDIQVSPDILLGLIGDTAAFKLLSYLHIKKCQTSSNFVLVDKEIATSTIGLKIKEYEAAKTKIISMFGYPVQDTKSKGTMFDLSKIATKANRHAKKVAAGHLFTGDEEPPAKKELTVEEKAEKERKRNESFDKFIEWFNKRLTDAGFPRKYKGTAPAKKNYFNLAKTKFTANDLGVAMDNALIDEWLVGRNMDPLTPEYFLREDVLNKYCNRHNQANG